MIELVGIPTGTGTGTPVGTTSPCSGTPVTMRGAAAAAPDRFELGDQRDATVVVANASQLVATRSSTA